MIFASEPIELTFNVLSKRSIQATKPYSGVLRIALIPPSTTKDQNLDDHNNNPVPLHPPYPSISSLSNSTTVKRLIYYSHMYPVGGNVSWAFRSLSTHQSKSTMALLESEINSSKIVEDHFNDVEVDIAWQTINSNSVHFTTMDKRQGSKESGGKENAFKVFAEEVLGDEETKNDARTIGKVTFAFNVKSMRSETSKDNLLMMALPHHAQVLPSKMIQKEFDLMYDCIKGKMTPVVGKSWYVNSESFACTCLCTLAWRFGVLVII